MNFIRYCLAILITLLAACQEADLADDSSAPQINQDSSAAIASFKGPIGTTGVQGHPMWDSWYDIGEVGYVEEEYFVYGTAKPHPTNITLSPPTSIPTGENAEYITRIIVRRPSIEADFNGTVLLDWVNVSAQFENAVDTLEAHRYLLRNGYAYVHVSAQAAGHCCTPLTLKVWDPVRYDELNHPGDEYAFDIVSQIARGFRTPLGDDPMGGLRPEIILIAGHSQSGMHLHQYVNELQAQEQAIDGFLIRGDISAGKDFGSPPAAPVIHVLSDWEAAPDEPASEENYVLWEVAGTSHQNLWVGLHQELGQGPRVGMNTPKQPLSADDDLHASAANYGEQHDPNMEACIAAGSAFPNRYAVAAAIDHLNRWVRTGAKPPQPPRFEFDIAGILARDEYGNALGGLRYPPIDHPIARYRTTECQLGGVTLPFSEVELLQLYPSHADYMEKMTAAVQVSIAAGYLLPPDGDELLSRARAASNRWLSN